MAQRTGAGRVARGFRRSVIARLRCRRHRALPRRSQPEEARPRPVRAGDVMRESAQGPIGLAFISHKSAIAQLDAHNHFRSTPFRWNEGSEGICRSSGRPTIADFRPRTKKRSGIYRDTPGIHLTCDLPSGND